MSYRIIAAVGCENEVGVVSRGYESEEDEVTNQEIKHLQRGEGDLLQDTSNNRCQHRSCTE